MKNGILINRTCFFMDHMMRPRWKLYIPRNHRHIRPGHTNSRRHVEGPADKHNHSDNHKAEVKSTKLAWLRVEYY